MAKEYVEREAWLKTLKTNKKFFIDGWGGFDALPPTDKARVDELDNCIALLIALPAADVVERKRGEWVINERGFAECTECKFERIGIPLVHRLNYCPNCGADMRGESDG